MPALRYLHLDVFTERPLEGNQLAVFPDPPDLSTEVMQAIAREMAFSESTFIYPPTGSGDVKMRIFTPGEELPMAGHPTIGSTYALALENRIPRGSDRFVFELGVGPTPVALQWSGPDLSFAWMTQLPPQFGPPITDLLSLARALGIEATAFARGLTPQRVSCGVPYLLVALATRADVDAVVLDRRALAACCQAAGFPESPVYFFSLESAASEETTYSRLLAPSLGVAEDPATGSASGPLGAYLVQHRVVTADEARRIVNVQGVAMRRPSRISISIEGEPDAITSVKVGGTAVMVGTGEIRV